MEKHIFYDNDYQFTEEAEKIAAENLVESLDEPLDENEIESLEAQDNYPYDPLKDEAGMQQQLNILMKDYLDEAKNNIAMAIENKTMLVRGWFDINRRDHTEVFQTDDFMDILHKILDFRYDDIDKIGVDEKGNLFVDYLRGNYHAPHRLEFKTLTPAGEERAQKCELDDDAYEQYEKMWDNPKYSERVTFDFLNYDDNKQTKKERKQNG